jgi:hypothetical protein
MYAYNSICILINSPKNASPPKNAPAPPALNPAQLLRCFIQLLPRQALGRLPSLKGRSFYDRLFNPWVTLWYLLFQRFHHDHSLQAALQDARAGGADRLNPRLSGQLTSDSTSAFSDARTRLPWPFLAEALSLQGQRLTRLSPATCWHGLILALLDGTTVRLRPHGRLPKVFPPNRNQARHAYWCLMRVVVCFCTGTGAALDCAMGSLHLSEQALACDIILRAGPACLFVGDRNFGIFRIAQAACQSKQAVLLRLTTRRAAKLLGRRLVAGDHPVTWRHTRHDQLQPDCDTQPVTGRLLVIQLQRAGFRSERLCLFTTLPKTADYSLPELVELYGQRWHAELNLRYLKAQMDLAQLEVKSPEMARKEWLAGLLAYNLIRGAQLCGALDQQVPPLTLSFSSVRRCLEVWLGQLSRTPRLASARWQDLLKQIGRCQLPRRRRPRPTEPRAQRHLRLPYAPLYGSRALARRRLKKYALKS